MGNSTLRRVLKGELRGWVRGEVWDGLPSDFFEDPLSCLEEMGGKILKRSKWRWAALLSFSDGGRVFFKRDKTKDWMEGLKYLFFPSRGRKEFLIASQLEMRGLPVPKPLGWIERVRKGWVKESYYLSEAIGTGVSFIEEVAKSKEPRSIAELATAVKKYQEARVISSGSSRRELFVAGRVPFYYRFTPCQNRKVGVLTPEVMEFVTSLSFLKIDVGRRGPASIPGSIL